MAYEARRDDLTKEEQKEQQKQENHEANRKAAAVGIDAGAKYAPGWIGGAFKAASAADKATGGLVSDVAAYGADLGNKAAPFVQGITNDLAKDKNVQKAYDAYNAKNGKGASAAADKAEKAKEGLDKAKEGAEKAKEAGDKAKEAGAKGKDLGNQMKKGGEQEDSLPSSSGEKNKPQQNGHTGDGSKPDEEKEKVEPNAQPEEEEKKSSGILKFATFAPVVIMFLPIIIIILLLLVFLATVANFADYKDAFGISQLSGFSTGGLNGTVSDPVQKDFYTRIINVRNDYQKEGKNVDPLLVVSVFHALNLYGANIGYKDFTTTKIKKIADAMFDGNNNYNENVFRINLKKNIIPSYLPNASDSTKDAIVNEVFDYIKRYYSLIKLDSGSCSGTCTYNIKGFNIDGSNYKKDITVNNLYVRLMQCGKYDGHDAGGQWGEPLEGEELVPFEKYILGVAYQEIGPGAPEEAFKAQMVAARSYILARPTQMKNSTSWRSLEQESDGRWVLQVASCTADQVYCDPDKGCSAENGDGQWKQVYSGTDHGKTLKGPLAEDSPLRDYATEVQGVTLVNDQDYIVLTGYTDTESKKFISLANEGYDYKQILMEVYSNKYPKAGITDVKKANCGTCSSNSSYASWKQYEGDWAGIEIGNSGKTIQQIGCLVTSLAIQVANSGVKTHVSNLNPGTFVKYLNKQNAFSDGGELLNYSSVESVAPSFKYQGYEDVGDMSREEKFAAIKRIVNQQGVYAVAEVKGDTGQHWVAIDSVKNDTITMMDPGSTYTNMWETYDWYNTSRIVYYKVG